MDFYFYSPVSFEKWDHRSPDSPGIAGSETAVCELAKRLARRGHAVSVYAPVPDDGPPRDAGGARWAPVAAADFAARGVWVLSRCPSALDKFAADHPGQQTWLVCQDVFYPPGMKDDNGLTAERCAKLDRCLPLCQDQEMFLLSKNPELAGKMFRSGNGVRTDLIEEIERDARCLACGMRTTEPAGDYDACECSEPKPPVRDPYKLVYTSSPDRGLITLLKIFRRARETEPRLNLTAAYGWDNIAKCEGKYWKNVRREADELMRQPGVTWLGRLPQPALYRQFLSAGLWVYPTTFTETSPVHGDTLVETLQGPVRIRDLVGRSNFPVYSCDAAGNLSVSTVRWVGQTRTNAPVVRLRARPGVGRNAKKEKELVLTPDHEVMLADGTYRPAGQLRVGDRVKAFHRRADGWGVGYAMVGVTDRGLRPEHQFVAARHAGRDLLPGEIVDHLDGNTRNNHPNNLIIRASQGDHAKHHWNQLSVEERQARVTKQADAYRAFLQNSESQNLREIRSRNMKRRWEAMTPEQRQAWIARRAAAETPEGREARRRASAARKEAQFGNAPWRDRETMRRLYVVENQSTVTMGKLLGCSDGCIGTWLKKHGIPVRSASAAQFAKKLASNHVVVGIDDAGTADVYCMEVDPDHNFVADGIFVHNCVSCMEAQAMGAVPVTNPLWALTDNVRHGVFLRGNPADEPLTRAQYVGEILRLTGDLVLQESIRAEMMPWAKKTFDWERVADRYEAMAAEVLKESKDEQPDKGASLQPLSL